jgi:hypothetical protein
MNRVPRWARRLLPHIKLTDAQIARLEAIRIDAGVDDVSMERHVQTHPQCTKMLQRDLFAEIKKNNPTAPDGAILMKLFYSRLLTARRQGCGLLGVRADNLRDEDNPPRDLLGAIVVEMERRSIRTVDDLADAIVNDESKLRGNVPTSASLQKTAHQISAVLGDRGRK